MSIFLYILSELHSPDINALNLVPGRSLDSKRPEVNTYGSELVHGALKSISVPNTRPVPGWHIRGM